MSRPSASLGMRRSTSLRAAGVSSVVVIAPADSDVMLIYGRGAFYLPLIDIMNALLLK